MSATKSSSSACTKVCCFCNLTEDNELDYGKFYEHNGIVTHYYCLLLSSNMEQKGNDDEGILGFLAADIQKELRRGKKLVCSYCKKVGATLGCCNLKCKRIFHFPCGQKAGSLHQFFGEFRSYCVHHRPKQDIDDYILKQVNSSKDILCYICYDKVDHSDPVGTLWAPCCKKDAWFHRKCVQQLALSAGYFFKCPLCNNKKEFQKAMLEYGIFIPSQDASWELVPHAFEELLYRHDRCDAVVCLCPKGRKHTSSNAKWELALCRTCGSQGIHMACGQLKWANPSWECSDCTSILRKRHGNTAPSSSSDSSSQSRDSSDSDTDISVGTDTPICLPSSHSSSFLPMESNTKLRPGPRSFKLLQQQMKNTMIKCTSQFMHTTSERNNTNETDPNDLVKLISKNDNLKKEPKTPKKDNLKQENNEKKENSSQQASKIDNSVEKRKSSSNTEKPVPYEVDVIVIDSDEDDIEIISLGQKKDLSSIQTAPTKILSLNPINETESSMASIYEITSRNKMLNNLLDIDITNSQKPNTSKSEILHKEESIALEKSAILIPQMLMHDTNSSKRDNVLEDVNAIDASVSSVMNIKITNVTSLPPEIFASVPEVGHEEKIAPVPDVNTLTNKSLEKWFATHIPLTKSDVREDGNPKRKLEFIRLPLNEVADCKKLKGDSCNKTCSTDKTQSTDSRDNIVHNTSRKQDQIISETGFNNIRGDTKDFSISMVSRNEISRSPIINKQSNELLIKSKADIDHVNAKANHLEENSASVIVQHSNESFSQLTNTSVIQSNNQFYVKIPPSNVFFAEPILDSNSKNSQCTENTGNVAYATASSDTVLPQVINTAMIDNRRTIFSNQPIATNVIESINANNNEIGMLNKQEIGLMKETSSKNVSISGNESSNKIVCDGDAGRTSPAVTRRSTCFSEIIENTRTNEILGTNSTSRNGDQSSKSHARVRRSLRWKIPGENDTMYISSAPYSPSTKNHDVFPQVTNNHNACHRPRLIPQYMHLQDLKFRVCGSDSVQMILYDMFSVNIPVENATQEKKSRSGVVSRESRESAISCRAQDGTLSSLDPTDGTTNCLNNSRTKCIADPAVVTVVHSNDDTKENLDPVARTVSRMLGNISVVNSVEDAAANDYICGEHDSHMRLISSDINLSLLKRTIRNTNIDSVENCIELIPNNRINQTLRFNLEDTQHKQSTCGISATIEDRIGAQLFCNKTVRSTDLDLNVVNTNKNVEKALLDDITVSTSRHVNGKEINSDHTDDSPIVCLKNSSITSNNCRSNDNYMSLNNAGDTGLKIRDWNVARVPSITFNESTISNKQINAYDSRQLLRCTVFHENTINPKIGNNSKYEINPCFKVSIDLRKIQNLIDSKPELFVNPEYIDDRRRRYTSPLSDEDYCAQEEQLSDYVSEEIQVQDPSSSANILV